MKRIFVLIVLLGVFAISCKKQTSAYISNEPVTGVDQAQQRPACGMEEAMAALSPEMKAALLNAANRTESQAAELLLFLDFDGAIVRAGFPNPTGYNSPIISGQRFCPPPSLNAEQEQAVIALVKDDYSPFNIVITTDQSVFDSYPAQNKQICIITTIPQVIGFGSGIGGVSPFNGIGSRLPFNPCFVFSNVYGSDLASIAGVISHETGHAMGLGHQHKFSEGCNFLAEYHPGFGTGPISFVPIMGDAGSKRIVNWFAQSCLSPTFGVPQNDFTLLNNQVALREDDFPGSPAGSAQPSGEITGVLEEDGDVDFIRINFRNPSDVVISSENIDVKVSVYTPGGHLLGTYDDPADTGITIPGLNGNRYLKIEAVSNANMSSQFMTGQYKIVY